MRSSQSNTRADFEAARMRASKLLNYRKPEHPPDIYFIRRKPELLDKYLNNKEMELLIRDAPQEVKKNYNIFKLDPIEKKISNELRTRKRSFINPEDPFYDRKGFNQLNEKVYST